MGILKMTIKQALSVQQIKLQKILDNEIYRLGRLWGRIRAECPTSLDDQAIERILRNISMPTFCIRRTKLYRDVGALYFEKGQLKYSEQKLTQWYHAFLRQSIKELCQSDLLNNLVAKYNKGEIVDHTSAALNIALRAIGKSFTQNEIRSKEAVAEVIESDLKLTSEYPQGQELRELVQLYIYQNLQLKS